MVCSGAVWSIYVGRRRVFTCREEVAFIVHMQKSGGGVVNTNAIDGLIDLSLESVIDAARKPL